MILNTVQKSLLIEEVERIFDNWGENQKKASIMEVVACCPKFKVETDGDIILFYDFEEDEILPFESVKDFEKFLFKQY